MIEFILMGLLLLIAFSVVITVAHYIWKYIFSVKKKSTEEMMQKDGVFDHLDWKNHKREEHSFTNPSLPYLKSPILSFPENAIKRDNISPLGKELKSYEQVLDYMSNKGYKWTDLAHYLENSQVEENRAWDKMEQKLNEIEFDKLPNSSINIEKLTKEQMLERYGNILTENAHESLKSSLDFLENYGLKLDKENTDSIDQFKLDSLERQLDLQPFIPVNHFSDNCVNKHTEYPLVPDECYKDYKEVLVAKNVHPGEIIKFLISDFGMSNTLRKMSTDMGFAFAYLSHIIHKRVNISVEASIKLDTYFNQPPNFFINVQTNYIRNLSKS